MTNAEEKKTTVPPTLPGEIWRGQVVIWRDIPHLCAVALPDGDDVPRWTHLEFGSDWPTVAVWFESAIDEGGWIPLDESEQGFVYAACIRALRAQKEPAEGG